MSKQTMKSQPFKKSPEQRIRERIKGTKREDRLNHLREIFDNWSWEVSDEISELYSELRAAEDEYTVLEVCSAVNTFLNSPFSAFTLYDFWLVSKTITDPGERVKYGVLPFSHLLFARRYHERTGNDWRIVLDYDFAAMDKNGGRLISRDALAYQFRTEDDPPPPEFDDQWDKDHKPASYLPPMPERDMQFTGINQAIKYIERNITANKFKNALQSVMAARIAALCRRFLENDFDAMKFEIKELTGTVTKAKAKALIKSK